jgi:8-oxo-dGTP pyrophosphatase MutT (NUDIX family)
LSDTEVEPDRIVAHDSDRIDARPARQVAALVWRRSPEIDVLLVTSRTTRRWVLPKGWPIEGRSPAEAAMQEAYEEAGVVAMPGHEPVGSYEYDKVLGEGSLLPCSVEVFAIPIGRLLDQWPEMSRRTRRWYGAEVAASLVAEPDLANLLRDFGRTAPISARQ